MGSDLSAAPPPELPADTPILRSYPPLLRNRNFLLLWSAYIVSSLGDRIHFIVMLELVSIMLARHLHIAHYEAGTKQSAQLTVMMLLPFLLFGTMTGILADRLPRRGIMLVSDASRAAIVVVARILFLRESTVMSFAALYGLLLGTEFLLAMFAACFSPARMALLPELVHPGQLLRANSMTNAAGTIASLIGFVIGGALVAISLQFALFADAAAFLASAAFLLFMRLPRDEQKPALATLVGESAKTGLAGVLRDLRAGLAYIWAHRRIMQVILLMLLFWCCGTIILNGLTGIVTAHFGLSIDSYAYFMGVVGVGMIFGAASVSLARRGVPKEVGIAWPLVGVGVCLFLFSLANSWQVGLAPLVLAAFFGAVLLVSLDTLLQRIVPNYVRGRVMGAKDVVTTFGLISVAVPLAIWQPQWGDLNNLIRFVLRYLAILVALVGLWLVRYYYRRGPMPAPVAIMRRLAAAYLALMHRFQRGNACRIPALGPAIFVGNHTSGLDPLILQTASPRRLIHFMMAREYYAKWPLRYFYDALGVIPVNRTGNDTAGIRAALRLLRNGGVLGMFPEGKISMNGQLQPAREGVALLALASGAPVVPAYIHGTHLHRGMIRDFTTPAHITAYFGPPLHFPNLVGHERDPAARAQATAQIMAAIAALQNRYAPPKQTAPLESPSTSKSPL